MIKTYSIIGCAVVALAVAGCAGQDTTSDATTPVNNSAPATADAVPATQPATSSTPSGVTATTNPKETSASQAKEKTDKKAASNETENKAGVKTAAAHVDASTPAPVMPGWHVKTLRTEAGGLQYSDLKIGTGKVAKPGDDIQVQYTGYLTDGTKFDSSIDRGTPFPFTLGAGMVIKGWDEGVAGMRVGGKRKLVIPADLAYGANGTPGGPIPPNAKLIFDVQLVKVGK